MGKASDANEIELNKRRSLVLRLRAERRTMRDIAAILTASKEFGEVSFQTVANDYKIAIKQSIKEQTASNLELIRSELDLLDIASVAIMSNVKKGHLGAIDRMVKIMDMRAKLQGLYAPVKVEGTMTWEQVLRADSDKGTPPDDPNPFA